MPSLKGGQAPLYLAKIEARAHCIREPVPVSGRPVNTTYHLDKLVNNPPFEEALRAVKTFPLLCLHLVLPHRVQPLVR